MPPDIDWGQVIFLALVVIVGFVRWVGNLIAQQKEAKARAALSPEEIALREAAWRRQVGLDEEEEEERDFTPTPTPRPTAPTADPFRELKDLFEQLKEPPPAPPPPIPPTRRIPPPLPVQRQAAPPSRPPVPAPKVFVPTPTQAFPTSHHVHRQFTEAVAHRDRPVSAKLTGLRRELATPKALRQAILIREVLGPPKALRAD